MTEKLHYEVRLIETDDGFRLEATGDKEALKKLGIGPNMLNRKWRGYGRKHGMKHGRKSGPRGMKRGRKFGPRGMKHGRQFGPRGMEHGREFGPRGMEHGPEFGPRGMQRRRARRAAMAQRRHHGHRHGDGPGRCRTSSVPRRRFRHSYGQEARFGAKGHRDTPEYL